MVQIAQVDATFLLGTTNWVDVDVPAHCSALGKVFFAAGVLPLPAEPLERRTRHTVTSLAALKRQLEGFRTQGYSEALGELEIGLDAVAAPVYDAQWRGGGRHRRLGTRATGSTTSSRSSDRCSHPRPRRCPASSATRNERMAPHDAR